MSMRTREEIEQEVINENDRHGELLEPLATIIELLLDIRDLLTPITNEDNLK